MKLACQPTTAAPGTRWCGVTCGWVSILLPQSVLPSSYLPPSSRKGKSGGPKVLWSQAEDECLGSAFNRLGNH